eukprot:CAMPEP_0204176472 /NCGR_PEP_ID=MMETSP0361-20130328/47630_1 /ASSEMBLY_ACC=CAM_ASM_000343 /TAXON_ID=268821 /ORGANISM="Scrippsiella Hangoei, Strain SHTV-5" /LENGTH=127 /DNA_ID=CAMNT_0051135271 /DNA_START=20 /DNA_END=403 /DNA_ORIENTATION=-
MSRIIAPEAAEAQDHGAEDNKHEQQRPAHREEQLEVELDADAVSSEFGAVVLSGNTFNTSSPSLLGLMHAFLSLWSSALFRISSGDTNSSSPIWRVAISIFRSTVTNGSNLPPSIAVLTFRDVIEER